MECRFAEQRLQAFLDGELGPAERAEIESHLESCRDCSSVLDELRRVGELGRLVYRGGRFSKPGFLQKVLERIEQAKSRPISGYVERIFAGYEILERIGTGAMGSVYKARQLSLDRIVALKILPQSLARDREFAERFLNEARASARLNHENIVRGIDAGRAGDTFYFAMEYVDGRPLRDLIRERGRLGESEAIDICVQIARALVHASEAGLIHRDIKPANILVTKTGVAKLCDLGLARPVKTDAHLTQEGMVVGTPHYIAPEQARGETDLDARVDIYSLGATLYTMLTGEVPFDGPTSAVVMARHVQDPFPDPRKLVPGLSSGICSVLFKMVAKDRRERYADARALLEALESLREGKPQGEPPSTTARARRVKVQPPRRAQAEWVRMALVGLGAAAAAVALYALVAPGRRPPPQERRLAAPTPPTSAEGPRADGADSIVQRIRSRFAENPSEAESQLKLLEEALPSLSGDSARAEAALLREELVAAAERSAREYIDRARRKATELADQGRFDLALAELGPLDATRAPARAKAGIERLRTEFAARAAEALSERLALVSSAGAGGAIPKAEDVLRGLPSDLAEPVRKEIERLAAERSAAPAAASSPAAPSPDALAELTRGVNEAVRRGDMEAARALVAGARLDARTAAAADALAREESFLADMDRARAALGSHLAAIAQSGAEVRLRGRDGRELVKGQVVRVDPKTLKLWLVSARPGGGSAESVVEIDRLDQSDLAAFVREELKGDAAAAERSVAALMVARGDMAAAEAVCRAAERAGLDLKAPLGRLLDLRRQEFARLFRGRVSLGEGGSVTIAWDFSQSSHLDDWVVHAWSPTGAPSGEPPRCELAQGFLKVNGLGGVRSKARFQGQLSVTFRVALSSVESGAAGLLGVDDARPGSFVAGVVGFDGRAFPERWSSAFPLALGEPRRLREPPAEGGPRERPGLSVALERSGGRFVFRVEGLPEWSCPEGESRGGSVALWSLGSEAAFDDVVVTGVVDPEWLRTASAGVQANACAVSRDAAGRVRGPGPSDRGADEPASRRVRSDSGLASATDTTAPAAPAGAGG